MLPQIRFVGANIGIFSKKANVRSFFFTGRAAVESSIPQSFVGKKGELTDFLWQLIPYNGYIWAFTLNNGSLSFFLTKTIS
ncbi:MAG TPA: hypothetical protein ENJ88_03620 [Phaeodactylibacter sp.]|nr:hypothetical protein [Phaeodactylibacter sp.]